MTREELISWRKQRGVNQGQMANMLGTSRQTVISWERGRYAIPDDLHIRLDRAAPAEATQRSKREGRIRPASHPHLYRFERDIMRHRPTPQHPIVLARKGLLGWRGLSWIYANVSNCVKPKADILDSDAYAQAIEDMAAGRKHPGIEAVKRFFQVGEIMPGVELVRGNPWPTLTLNEAVAPWAGFNTDYEVPPSMGAGAQVIVRPPLPAGYFWAPDDRLVFLEDVDGQ